MSICVYLSHRLADLLARPETRQYAGLRMGCWPCCFVLPFCALTFALLLTKFATGCRQWAFVVI